MENWDWIFNPWRASDRNEIWIEPNISKESITWATTGPGVATDHCSSNCMWLHTTGPILKETPLLASMMKVTSKPAPVALYHPLTRVAHGVTRPVLITALLASPGARARVYDPGGDLCLGPRKSQGGGLLCPLRDGVTEVRWKMTSKNSKRNVNGQRRLDVPTRVVPWHGWPRLEKSRPGRARNGIICKVYYRALLVKTRSVATTFVCLHFSTASIFLNRQLSNFRGKNFPAGDPGSDNLAAPRLFPDGAAIIVPWCRSVTRGDPPIADTNGEKVMTAAAGQRMRHGSCLGQPDDEAPISCELKVENNTISDRTPGRSNDHLCSIGIFGLTMSSRKIFEETQVSAHGYVQELDKVSIRQELAGGSQSQLPEKKCVHSMIVANTGGTTISWGARGRMCAPASGRPLATVEMLSKTDVSLVKTQMDGGPCYVTPTKARSKEMWPHSTEIPSPRPVFPCPRVCDSTYHPVCPICLFKKIFIRRNSPSPMQNGALLRTKFKPLPLVNRQCLLDNDGHVPACSVALCWPHRSESTLPLQRNPDVTARERGTVDCHPWHKLRGRWNLKDQSFGSRHREVLTQAQGLSLPTPPSDTRRKERPRETSHVNERPVGRVWDVLASRMMPRWCCGRCIAEVFFRAFPPCASKCGALLPEIARGKKSRLSKLPGVCLGLIHMSPAPARAGPWPWRSTGPAARAGNGGTSPCGGDDGTFTDNAIDGAKRRGSSTGHRSQFTGCGMAKYWRKGSTFGDRAIVTVLAEPRVGTEDDSQVMAEMQNISRQTTRVKRSPGEGEAGAALSHSASQDILLNFPKYGLFGGKLFPYKMVPLHVTCLHRSAVEVVGLAQPKVHRWRNCNNSTTGGVVNVGIFPQMGRPGSGLLKLCDLTVDQGELFTFPQKSDTHRGQTVVPGRSMVGTIDRNAIRRGNESAVHMRQLRATQSLPDSSWVSHYSSLFQFLWGNFPMKIESTHGDTAYFPVIRRRPFVPRLCGRGLHGRGLSNGPDTASLKVTTDGIGNSDVLPRLGGHQVCLLGMDTPGVGENGLFVSLCRAGIVKNQIAQLGKSMTAIINRGSTSKVVKLADYSTSARGSSSVFISQCGCDIRIFWENLPIIIESTCASVACLPTSGRRPLAPRSWYGHSLTAGAPSNRSDAAAPRLGTERQMTSQPGVKQEGSTRYKDGDDKIKSVHPSCAGLDCDHVRNCFTAVSKNESEQDPSHEKVVDSVESELLKNDICYKKLLPTAPMSSIQGPPLRLLLYPNDFNSRLFLKVKKPLISIRLLRSRAGSNSCLECSRDASDSLGNSLHLSERENRSQHEIRLESEEIIYKDIFVKATVSINPVHRDRLTDGSICIPHLLVVVVHMERITEYQADSHSNGDNEKEAGDSVADNLEQLDAGNEDEAGDSDVENGEQDNESDDDSEQEVDRSDDDEPDEDDGPDDDEDWDPSEPEDFSDEEPSEDSGVEDAPDSLVAFGPLEEVYGIVSLNYRGHQAFFRQGLLFHRDGAGNKCKHREQAKAQYRAEKLVIVDSVRERAIADARSHWKIDKSIPRMGIGLIQVRDHAADILKFCLGLNRHVMYDRQREIGGRFIFNRMSMIKPRPPELWKLSEKDFHPTDQEWITNDDSEEEAAEDEEIPIEEPDEQVKAPEDGFLHEKATAEDKVRQVDFDKPEEEGSQIDILLITTCLLAMASLQLKMAKNGSDSTYLAVALWINFCLALAIKIELVSADPIHMFKIVGHRLGAEMGRLISWLINIAMVYVAINMGEEMYDEQNYLAMFNNLATTAVLTANSLVILMFGNRRDLMLAENSLLLIAIISQAKLMNGILDYVEEGVKVDGVDGRMLVTSMMTVSPLTNLATTILDDDNVGLKWRTVSLVFSTFAIIHLHMKASDVGKIIKIVVDDIDGIPIVDSKLLGGEVSQAVVNLLNYANDDDLMNSFRNTLDPTNLQHSLNDIDEIDEDPNYVECKVVQATSDEEHKVDKGVYKIINNNVYVEGRGYWIPRSCLGETFREEDDDDFNIATKQGDDKKVEEGTVTMTKIVIPGTNKSADHSKFLGCRQKIIRPTVSVSISRIEKSVSKSMNEIGEIQGWLSGKAKLIVTGCAHGCTSPRVTRSPGLGMHTVCYVPNWVEKQHHHRGTHHSIVNYQRRNYCLKIYNMVRVSLNRVTRSETLSTRGRRLHLAKSGGMSRWAKGNRGYASLKAPCSGRFPRSHIKNCHLLSKLYCECGPDNKKCCDRTLDRLLATPVNIKKLKNLLSHNDMASVVEVYLFQLVDFDNDTGAYTVRDQADLTEEQKEIGIALGMVGAKITEIFDDAIESLENAEESSITKRFVKKSLKSGTPEGRTWKSILVEAGVGDVLDERSVATLIDIVKRNCKIIDVDA